MPGKRHWRPHSCHRRLVILSATFACLCAPSALAYQEREDAEGAQVFSISYTGNFLSNVSGGQSRGSSYTHELDVGASFQIADKWTFAVTGAWTQGAALSDQHVGDFGGLQGTFNDANALWLYEAYAAYSGEKLAFAAGRLSAGDTFASLDIMGNFVNATFSSNAGAISTNAGGFTTGPTSTWGAYLAYATSETSTFTVGAYLSAQNNFSTDDHGLDFSFNPGDGVLIAAEYRQAFSEAAFGFGAYYDTADAEVLTETQATRDARADYGFYSYIEGPLTPTGPTAMIMLQLAPEKGLNLFPLFILGALSWNGIVPARPRDRMSLGIAYGKISNRLESLRDEVVFELNCTAVVNDIITVQPVAQYVSNPGGTEANALIFGVQLSVEF
ncbi:MAG: hypothetical protein COB37_05980 [Kordiimonadales bacterium]|nr:MAG: hypothetical protein COB37_05980 [Kordiimonadales bacterium]